MKATTALTGFLVPKCKIYGNGFFSKESKDPDNFSKKINSISKEVYDKYIDEEKERLNSIKEKKYLKIDSSRLRIENGLIIIERFDSRKPLHKNLDDNTYTIASRDTPMSKIHTYRDENGLKRDETGAFLIERTKLQKTGDIFIIEKRKK